MFYLLHGDDEYSRSLELARMKAKLGDATTVDLNTTVLDGQKAALDELMHACDTVPFLSDRRLVIVHDLAARFEARQGRDVGQSEEEKAFLHRLREYLAHLPDTARLVFLERKRIGRANPIYKLARDSEHGYEREFRPPRGAALDRWIAERVRDKGGQIEAAAVNLLAAFVGSDLRLLDTEVEKLITYVGEGRPIREQDVQLVVSYVQEADVFEMVDAVGRRDGRQAMKVLHRLLESGQPPLYLLAMIIRQFRILLRVKELGVRGTSLADMKALLGLHPFVVEKAAKQSLNFSLAQLQDIYHRLLDVDLAVKTGEIEPRLALSMLVTEMRR